MRKFFLVIAYVFLCAVGFAQGEANIWYFGQNVGLDFSDPANPVMLSDGSNTVGASQGGEGTSSICNAAGDLLFYSDGDKIYRGNHTTLIDVNSNQDISQNLIVPDPANPNQYYFITPRAVNETTADPGIANQILGFDYTLVSATTSADAAVVGAANTNFYTGNVAQALTAVPDDANGYWLVGKERGSTNFLIWHITAGGISAVNTVAIGSSILNTQYISALKVNSCSNKIAITYMTQNLVEVFSFDNSVAGGTAGEPIALDYSFTGMDFPYGLEFSPNGNYLYVSLNGEGAHANGILQYDLTNGTNVQVANHAPGGPDRSGHLQLGPDRKIYVSYYSRWGADGGYIGVINDPDVAGAGCNHVANAYDWGVNGWGPAQGLPPILRNFVSSVAALKIDGVDASSTAVCEGDQVWLRVDVDGSFSGGVNWVVNEPIDGVSNPAGDSVLWTFDNVGTNTVAVDVTDNCGNNVAVDVGIDVNEIIAPVITQSCPGPILTGETGRSYNFYSDAGGTTVLASNVNSFDATGETTVYVEDLGNATAETVGFTAAGSWPVSAATRSMTFSSSTPAIIDGFEIDGNYASTNNVTYNVTISDGSGVIAGPVSVTVSGQPATVTGMGLFVPAAGSYTMTIDGGTWAEATGGPNTGSGILGGFGTGPFANFDVMEVYPCREIAQVNVQACCTAPSVTVTTQGATVVDDTLRVLACDDTTLTVDVIGTGTGLAYQWYSWDGSSALSALGGASGTVNAGASNTSPTISASGWYAFMVADVAGNLLSCGQGDTVWVDITSTPSAPSVTAVSICTGQQLNLAVNSANTDYTYNWTGPNAYSATGATQTVIANATITPTDYSGNYPVTATENGCTSTASNLAVTLTQSPTVTVNVDTTFCAYPFDLADLHGTPSNGTISYLNNANGSISSTVNADATYKIVVADGSCADTTDVTTTETGDPTASWAGGSGVCAGNSTDLTVTITGGSANYTVYYTDGSSTANATHTASGQAISLGAGTYTLDSVVDNNGCSHSNIGDTETISTQADVDATVSVLCDGETGVNGALANNEFQLMVNIDAGDTTNAIVEIVGTTYGVTFTETSTGIWHSSPIVEDTTLDIRVRDTRCDTVTGSYNRVCSCPGVITISGATKVCNNETAELTLTLDGVGPFDFELQQNGTVYNGATLLGVPYGGSQTNVPLVGSPTTVTIVVADSGTYTIADLIDNGAGACAGSEIGAELVEFYTHPDGDIGLDAVTGESPICPDGNTDVDIEVTQGAQGPFTVYYSTEGSQTTGVTTGTGLGTIDVIADTGTVILDSIVDANGCASTNINETVTITAHDTLIVDVQTTCSDDAGTATPNDGYTISVVATQSSINTVSINSGSITNSGGTWTSSIINEGTPVEITVTDVNGCNTVVVSDIQRTCSCPTVAVLTHAATPEGCEGDMVTLQLDTTAGALTSTSFTASVTGPNGVTPINITAGTVFPYEFTVADSGLYTLTVFTDNTAGQGGGACDAQLDDDTAMVHIYSLPTATLAGGSESCIGSPSDPVTINVTGAGSSWGVDYTQDATANNTTITSAGESTLIGSTTNAADTGTYTITGVTMDVGNNLTCTGTSFSGTPEIKFSPAQGASIDSDVDICKDSTGTLTANNEGGGVTYSWTLNGDEVGTSLTQDVTNAAGVYTLTTKKNGCADQTATATVSVTEIVVTAIATPEIVSEGDNIAFSTTTNGTSCEWFDPNMTSIGSNCSESYAPPAPGGIYTVVSTNGTCVGTDQVDVTVIQPIKVPDAFTPNVDGINDEFTIIGISTYDGATVSIYNRWGNLVYYIYGGDNYDAAPWDGTLNGKELPAGVYYYTIDLGLSVEQSELVPDSAPISGSVMLFK